MLNEKRVLAHYWEGLDGLENALNLLTKCDRYSTLQTQQLPSFLQISYSVHQRFNEAILGVK
jgi:hypothetical protein